jgi:ElaB/YqjD/DUF883 family membrane-anchored ribosome-binding protein
MEYSFIGLRGLVDRGLGATGQMDRFWPPPNLLSPDVRTSDAQSYLRVPGGGLIELAAKQENNHEDFDDMVRQLRDEFDQRFSELDERMSKSQRMERETLEQGQDVVRELRHRLREAGDRVNDGIDQADDLVRDHPVLVVGGALAVGLALGALLSVKSRGDSLE